MRNMAFVCVAIMVMLAVAPEVMADDSSPATQGFDTFDQVDKNGTNLRQVLATHPLVKTVLPFGDRMTYIETDGDGVLRSIVMHSDVNKAFHRLCRTRWQTKEVEYDVMTGKAVLQWKDVLPGKLERDHEYIHTHFVVDPESHRETRINGARCEGAFTWGAMLWIGESGVTHVKNYGFILHDVGQLYAWKSANIPEPKEFPPEGIVPSTYFGEKYAGSLLSASFYPRPMELVAWSSRLCELQKGRLKGAYQKSVYSGGGTWLRKPIIQTDVQTLAGDLPTDEYYLACEETPNGFLLRKFMEGGSRERVAFQKGRTLESVGKF